MELVYNTTQQFVVSILTRLFMNNCLNCKKETKNPKYCSRKCSVSNNNKIQPKRLKVTKPCKICQGPTNRRKLLCSNCKSNENNLTLDELTYKKSLPQQALNYIRYLSRQKGKKLFSQCFNCDYSKHIEIAHIKPITDFDKTTKILEINHESNLLGLCPNCHWEFDHDAQFKQQILIKYGTRESNPAMNTL